MTKISLGVFEDRQNAETAIAALEKKGYPAEEISIVTKEEGKTTVKKEGRDMSEGVVSGATTGGVIGGIAGLLIGVGAIAIPGIGGVLIGEPLAAALGLTGAAATTVSGAVTGALAGGLVGGLVKLGVPKEAAEEYERCINRGGILLAVKEEEGKEGEVREILEGHNAQQVRTISGTAM